MDPLTSANPLNPNTQAILKNRNDFNSMVKIATSSRSEQRQIQLCSQAAIFAVQNPCGIFNSQQLEDCLTRIAVKHTTPLFPPAPNSVLHVMTRAYTSGGHTRMCERWINAAPAHQSHSIALIAQGSRSIPALLNQATHNKNGTVISLSEAFPLQQALKLRELASSYQTIVLHTHMYDIVPILAFGTEKFTSPVVIYNHADHLFWMGCSVADLTINLRTLTSRISQKFRHITNNTVMPLMVTKPAAIKPDMHKVKALKAELGFPEDAKVIITIASPYKYRSTNNLNFIETALSILDQSPNTYLLAIGPSLAEPEWKAAHNQTHGRINAIGIVPHSQLDSYLALADMALDSFPMSSLTAVLDIARNDIACLTLATLANSYDAFEQSGISCQSPAEIIEKSIEILKNPPQENVLYKILKNESFPESTALQIKRIETLIPAKHAVHSVVQDDRPLPSEFELAIAGTILTTNSTPKGELIRLIRKIMFLYARFMFPLGLTRKLHVKLNQYGIL